MSHTHQEYVLDNEGKFCRRTVVTTPIADADTVLSHVKDDGVPILYPFSHKITVMGSQDEEMDHEMRFLSYSTRPHVLHTFTALPYFPFKGANLMETQELSDSETLLYNLHIPNGRNGEPSIRHGNLQWFPQVDRYYLFAYTSYNFLDSVVNPTYIFLFKEGKAYFPSLPNVYHDGKLCAGDDYEHILRTGSSFKGLMETHSKNLRTFYNAPCNNDLRDFSCEKYVVLFDQDGNTKPAPDKEMAARFYRDCTHSVINDYIRVIK